jgi:hypothetical protein
MTAIVPLLRARAEFLDPILELLDEHVYQPITAGQLITIGKIQSSDSKPLMSRIEAAIEDVRPIEDSVEDEGTGDGSGTE